MTMVDTRTNYTKEISQLVNEAYGDNIRIFGNSMGKNYTADKGARNMRNSLKNQELYATMTMRKSTRKQMEYKF